MHRQAINPENNWSNNFHYNQGEIIEGTQRTLYLAGQISAESDPSSPIGVSVTFKGDQRKQMINILEKIDYLIEKAGMLRKNIVQIRFYTVDTQGFLQNYDVYAEWIQDAEIKPTNSVLGIKELALPGAMLEIEVVAAE